MPVLRKLNAARAKFHQSEIKKTGYNSFSKYYYFDLSDFVVPALSIFNALDLCAVVSFDATSAKMTITDLEDASELVITSPMSSAALKGCHEVQNLGAVQTYLRRYLWVCALEIVEHDALDSGPPVEKKTDKPAAKKDAGGVISATAGALDAIPADEREYIKEMAADFVASKDFIAIVERLDAEGLDNEQKIALWSLLPSHIRSGIKKQQEDRNVTA